MADDPAVGTQVGAYRIVSVIGRGGMGVVYMAEHAALGRRVALKLLAPQYTNDASFRARFERESRVAAALDHPNVVPIYEAGESNGVLFIAMRYVAGPDLRAVLEREHRFSIERTLRILAQLASALDHAHSQGLIHRDVKPGNVLLAPGHGTDGGEHVYLTDFGLTKHSTSNSGLTQVGQLVGTIDYIAPEQITGDAVDGRADIYALGCVLFEMLAGRSPFARDSDVATMAAHLHQPPPSLNALRPELPIQVDELIGHALAKQPADRFASALSLTAQARIALAGGTSGATGRSDQTVIVSSPPQLPAAGLPLAATPTEVRPPDDPASAASPAAPERQQTPPPDPTVFSNVSSQPSSGASGGAGQSDPALPAESTPSGPPPPSGLPDTAGPPPPPLSSGLPPPPDPPPTSGPPPPPPVAGGYYPSPPVAGGYYPPPAPVPDRRPLWVAVIAALALVGLLALGAFALISGNQPTTRPTGAAQVSPSARPPGSVQPTRTPTRQTSTTTSAPPSTPRLTANPTPSPQTPTRPPTRAPTVRPITAYDRLLAFLAAEMNNVCVENIEAVWPVPPETQATCTTETLTRHYVLFANREDLDAAWADIAGDPGSGQDVCRGTTAAFPGHTWNYGPDPDDFTRGRVTCFTNLDNFAQLNFTVDDLHLFGVFISRTEDETALTDVFNDDDGLQIP